MEDKSESSERAEDSSGTSEAEDARPLSHRRARTSCNNEHHRRALWPSVDQTLRQRNTGAIDSSQIGQHRNVPNSSKFGRAGFVNKDNTLGTSGGLKTVFSEDSENSDSHSDCTFKPEGDQKRMNDKTPCHPERKREGYRSSSTSAIPSTSASNSVNEMEVIENMFSDKLRLKEHILFGGYSGTLSTASNENLNVSQSESTGKKGSEFLSTGNDNTPMDFLPSTGSLGSPINTGKRTRKTAIPIILLSPPPDSSNLGTKTNSPDLEEQSYPDQIEISKSEVFPDYQGTKGASANIKPRKVVSPRRRRIERWRSEPREFFDSEIPSCSYAVDTTESQVQLESSESDVAYDHEYMKILEETGVVPDVKDLKKKIKREKYSPSHRSRSKSTSRIDYETEVRIKGWSVDSSKSSFRKSTSPNKEEGTELGSSSSEKDSRTTTPKKHRLRRKPVDLLLVSDLVQSNPELVRKAEALSSSEDATPTKRLKRHPTEENLNKEPDSSVSVSGSQQESRLPEASPNRKKPRSPRYAKNRKKPRSPKN